MLRETSILELVLKIVIVDVVFELSTNEDHQVIVAICGASVYTRVEDAMQQC